MPVTYICYDLPKNATALSALLDRYVKFRLDAIANEAGHFTATHAYESTFTRQMWMARLLDPKKHHLIVVSHQEISQKVLENPGDGEWVGMIQLLGPLSLSEYFGSGSESSDETKGGDDEEVGFHTSTFYVSTAHRSPS